MAGSDPRSPRPKKRTGGRPAPPRGRQERPKRTSGRGEDGPKQWGALARRGSRRLAEDVRGQGTKPPQQGPKAPRDEDRWVLEETVRHEARGAVERGARTGARRNPRRKGPPPRRDGAERAPSAGSAGSAGSSKVDARLRDASRAFERGRFPDARRILKPLADQAPDSAAVHELLGLTHYRLGQWNAAIKELETFRTLTLSTEQHPVLADSYRALKRWPMVEELWDELRQASPSAELVAEGRIVMAGSLADRGRLAEAIRTLEPAVKASKRPKPHHLRMAYALADLKERSGDIPAARNLFEWIARHDPELADAADRADALA